MVIQTLSCVPSGRGQERVATHGNVTGIGVQNKLVGALVTDQVPKFWSDALQNLINNTKSISRN